MGHVLMEHHDVYYGGFKISLWMRCWYAGNRGHHGGGLGWGSMPDPDWLTNWLGQDEWRAALRHRQTDVKIDYMIDGSGA